MVVGGSGCWSECFLVGSGCWLEWLLVGVVVGRSVCWWVVVDGG